MSLRKALRNARKAAKYEIGVPPRRTPEETCIFFGRYEVTRSPKENDDGNAQDNHEG